MAEERSGAFQQVRDLARELNQYDREVLIKELLKQDFAESMNDVGYLSATVSLLPKHWRELFEEDGDRLLVEVESKFKYIFESEPRPGFPSVWKQEALLLAITALRELKRKRRLVARLNEVLYFINEPLREQFIKEVLKPDPVDWRR